MGIWIGAARFLNGHIYYWRYQYDACQPTLYKTVDQALGRYRSSQCKCGQDEEAELHVLESYWTGRACERCMCITDNGEGELDDDKAIDGEPAWLTWYANIVPTSGGTHNAAKELWEAIANLIAGDSAYGICGHNGSIDHWGVGINDDYKELRQICSSMAKRMGGIARGLRALKREDVPRELCECIELWIDHISRMRDVYSAVASAAKTIERETNAHSADRDKRDKEWSEKFIESIDNWMLESGLPPEPEDGDSEEYKQYIDGLLKQIDEGYEQFKQQGEQVSGWNPPSLPKRESHALDGMEKKYEDQLEQFEKEFKQLEEQGEHLADRTVELRAQLTKQFGVEFPYVGVCRK